MNLMISKAGWNMPEKRIQAYNAQARKPATLLRNLQMVMFGNTDSAVSLSPVAAFFPKPVTTLADTSAALEKQKQHVQEVRQI